MKLCPRCRIAAVKLLEAHQKLRSQLAAKEELYSAAFQILERHHQKQLDAAVEEAVKNMTNYSG